MEAAGLAADTGGFFLGVSLGEAICCRGVGSGCV